MVHIPPDQYFAERLNLHDSSFGFGTVHCCLPSTFSSGLGSYSFSWYEGYPLYHFCCYGIHYHQHTQVLWDKDFDTGAARRGWECHCVHHWRNRIEVCIKSHLHHAYVSTERGGMILALVGFRGPKKLCVRKSSMFKELFKNISLCRIISILFFILWVALRPEKPHSQPSWNFASSLSWTKNANMYLRTYLLLFIVSVNCFLYIVRWFVSSLVLFLRFLLAKSCNFEVQNLQLRIVLFHFSRIFKVCLA